MLPGAGLDRRHLAVRGFEAQAGIAAAGSRVMRVTIRVVLVRLMSSRVPYSGLSSASVVPMCAPE